MPVCHHWQQYCLYIDIYWYSDGVSCPNKTYKDVVTIISVCKLIILKKELTCFNLTKFTFNGKKLMTEKKVIFVYTLYQIASCPSLCQKRDRECLHNIVWSVNIYTGICCTSYNSLHHFYLFAHFNSFI